MYIVRYTRESWAAMAPDSDRPTDPNDPARIVGEFTDEAEAHASAARMNSIPSGITFEVVSSTGETVTGRAS